MYIKHLKIEGKVGIIREIEFYKGLNLIVDNTPSTNSKTTGNNVGKTTVLKLIDYCLGATGNIIYTDQENKSKVYDEVKEFLMNEEVIITLILTDDLNNENSKTIVIERNFLQRKKAIRKINGKDVKDKDFDCELSKLLLPNKTIDKPTFRQTISHNIRYKDESINNTLKTLGTFVSDIEYEAIYLFLLGCSFDHGAKKVLLTSKLKKEEVFKERLEKSESKTTYLLALDLVNEEIEILNQKKSLFNINENLERDLEQLNIIKYKINKLSSVISKLDIRKTLIEDSKKELEQSTSHIDINQLKNLYNDASINVTGIQKTFEDLVMYHNNMVIEKVKFISKELPSLNEKIVESRNELSILIKEEKELVNKVSKGDSFEELENIIVELNNKYRMKGEYESIIAQLDDVEKNIKELNDEIKKIDENLFSIDFKDHLKEQIHKFNKLFSSISQELYGESYILTYAIENNKAGQTFYKFSAFNANMSSGKKQGEIICFDLAYILFADEEKIDCLHFLLNDKKELMHDHQMIKVVDFIKDKNIQLVISILKDKLPKKVLEQSHTILELSQEQKLLKIESYK